MRRDKSLRRPRHTREIRPTYLIVCEGKVTEKEYLSDLRISETIPIDLQFIAGAVPKTLVERAVGEVGRNTGLYDEAWVIFDIDEHPNVAAALDQAYANDLKVVVSNPCFELWALLHFEYHSAAIHRKDLHKLCVKRMPGYVKELPFSELSPLYETALSNAKRLNAWHATRGTTGANPSTNVYELTESIRSRRR